jgi:hypothetical protein
MPTQSFHLQHKELPAFLHTLRRFIPSFQPKLTMHRYKIHASQIINSPPSFKSVFSADLIP